MTPDRITLPEDKRSVRDRNLLDFIETNSNKNVKEFDFRRTEENMNEPSKEVKSDKRT